MKKNLIWLAVIICFIFLYLGSIVSGNTPENDLKLHDNPFTEGTNLEFIDEYTQQQMILSTSSQKISNSYTPHDPIDIYNDNDFKTVGFTGNGLFDDPYIFENYTITNDSWPYLISITNTNAYFIIRNNIFDGIDRNREGIELLAVPNGVIENNTIVNTENAVNIEGSCSYITINGNIIKNSYRGIGGDLYNCYDCNIRNNIIFNNTQNGIWPQGVFSRIIISNNTVYNNGGTGIYIRDDNGLDIQVMNNTVVNNARGIYITTYIGDATNKDITIYNNSIIGHSGVGVYIRSSSGNLTSNTILNNAKGIELTGSGTNIISKNIVGSNNYSIDVGGSGHSITENTFYSEGGHIYITASYLNVKWNDFIGHELIEDAQAYASTGDFSENYWDDWTCPDADADGIVDNPYPLSWSINDASPLTSPHNDLPANLHLLSRPRIIYPKESEEEFKGSITVKWCSVTDFSGHSVSYNLYYSFDPQSNESETVWEELATDLNTAEYEWDTTSIDSESKCALKVVAVCSEGLTSEYWSYNSFKIDNRETEADGESTDGWSFTMLTLSLCLLVFASRRKRRK